VYLSPDGDSIVFLDSINKALKKVRVSGGRPATIVRDVADLNGLSWSRDGSIVFSAAGNPALLFVADSGGELEELTDPENGEIHSHPHLLPDGSAVLFDISLGEASTTEGFTSAHAQIAVRSMASGETRILTEGWDPRVTSNGYLLFIREGAVWRRCSMRRV